MWLLIKFFHKTSVYKCIEKMKNLLQKPLTWFENNFTEMFLNSLSNVGSLRKLTAAWQVFHYMTIWNNLKIIPKKPLAKFQSSQKYSFAGFIIFVWVRLDKRNFKHKDNFEKHIDILDILIYVPFLKLHLGKIEQQQWLSGER